MTIFALALGICCICVHGACAEGLGTLIEAGNNMAEIAKAQNAQTARFERVQQGIASGAIGEGAAIDAVIARFGEPVVRNTDNATGREKIVYMPATSDFFKGVKIYLYFTSSGLDEIVTKE